MEDGACLVDGTVIVHLHFESGMEGPIPFEHIVVFEALGNQLFFKKRFKVSVVRLFIELELSDGIIVLLE